MGLKTLATTLSNGNIRTRDGGRWGISAIHQILTRSTYIDEHRFNTRDHKTRQLKPESEHAVMAVPPIISREEFEAVRAKLKARNPRWTPPGISSCPNLLTGICFFAACGGAMTLRTGRGRAGGHCRYYACSTKARMGAAGCKGMAAPMNKLDEAVIAHLEDRLLEPQRLERLGDVRRASRLITRSSFQKFRQALRTRGYGFGQAGNDRMGQAGFMELDPD